ncbi:hypothetical protein F5148DRAFT_1150235 [Russula earlei]|uniref:Uncharacterized protein n=1 Tax=Russula earlei TaxID=71964 RepID=A0ACC0U520_9AGAM|nr:hypothetical protein F5148DRAFT_1150235 [Russula earlei]
MIASSSLREGLRRECIQPAGLSWITSANGLLMGVGVGNHFAPIRPRLPSNSALKPKLAPPPVREAPTQTSRWWSATRMLPLAPFCAGRPQIADPQSSPSGMGERKGGVDKPGGGRCGRRARRRSKSEMNVMAKTHNRQLRKIFLRVLLPAAHDSRSSRSQGNRILEMVDGFYFDAIDDAPPVLRSRWEEPTINPETEKKTVFGVGALSVRFGIKRKVLTAHVAHIRSLQTNLVFFVDDF